jgi:hypothetical protein
VAFGAGGNVFPHTLDFDAFDAAHLAHPQAEGVWMMWEAELEAGETIFIPSGAPHQVVNLAPVVASSVNFVDQSNLAAAEQAAAAPPQMMASNGNALSLPWHGRPALALPTIMVYEANRWGLVDKIGHKLGGLRARKGGLPTEEYTQTVDMDAGGSVPSDSSGWPNTWPSDSG